MWEKPIYLVDNTSHERIFNDVQFGFENEELKRNFMIGEFYVKKLISRDENWFSSS